MARNWWILVCPLLLILGNVISIGLERTPLYKDGWVNIVFVKRGWLWTAIAAIWLYLVDAMERSERSYDCTVTNEGEQVSFNLLERIKKYAIILLWWYTFTQHIPLTRWPPLMDVIFLVTGGSCNFNVFDSRGHIDSAFHETVWRRRKAWRRIYELLQGVRSEPNVSVILSRLQCALAPRQCSVEDHHDSHGLHWNHLIRGSFESREQNPSSQACRVHGGVWEGGHDPSGHVFLLTLLITCMLDLLSSIGPQVYHSALKNWRQAREDYRRTKNTTGNSMWTILRPWVTFLLLTPLVPYLALLFLWLYSFWHTSASWYHTKFEQWSGLIAALAVAGPLFC